MLLSEAEISDAYGLPSRFVQELYRSERQALPESEKAPKRRPAQAVGPYERRTHGFSIDGLRLQRLDAYARLRGLNRSSALAVMIDSVASDLEIDVG